MRINNLETAVAIINAQANAFNVYCRLVAAYLDGQLLMGQYGDREEALFDFTKAHLDLLERMREDK